MPQTALTDIETRDGTYSTEQLLGAKVTHEVSGLVGMIRSVSDHITGCTRLEVQPTEYESNSMRRDGEFVFPCDVTVEDVNFYRGGVTPETTCDITVGDTVEDEVTDMTGTASVVCCQLRTCPRVVVSTDSDDGTVAESIDAPRLTVTDSGDSVVDDGDDDGEAATGAGVDVEHKQY
jgi:hypothetical protein